MANHCRLAAASAVAAVDAVVNICDAGGTGTLVIYTGAEPAYADDGVGDEVATCTLSATAYGSASADGANKWAEANLTATASDTSATGNVAAVTYFRLKSGGGATVLQGTIGTSGADLNLNAVIIGAGAQVDITALEVRCPYNQA